MPQKGHTRGWGVRRETTNTGTYFVARISQGEASIIIYVLSSNAWRSLGGGEGVRALVLVIVFVGGGLNSSGDPDVNVSCWELLLHEEARLVVGQSGEGDD